MVRGKATDAAEKKPAPQRKAAAAKKAAPEKAPEEIVEIKKENEAAEDAPTETAEDTPADTSVDTPAETAESTLAETAEDTLAAEETAETEEAEKAEDAGNEEEGDDQIEGEEKVEPEGKAEPKPLSEEDKAFIEELLKTKIKLSDDSEAFVFSYGPIRPGFENKPRPLVCHLCRLIERSSGIKAHLLGKRHKESLKRNINNAERFKQPFVLFYSKEGEKGKQFQIYPGENIEKVTPEYEDRLIDKVEWEFKKIDDEHLLNLLNVDPVYDYNKTKPVIGLDYLLKMKDPKVSKSKRYCVLCDEYLQFDTYQHVTGIGHQATYIIKHFPKLYEKVHQGLKIRNARVKESLVRDVFRKLYRKIEIKHGFKKMIPVDFADFKAVRSRYVYKIRQMPHYGEDTLDFTEAEVNVLIKKCNNGIPFNDPDPPTLQGTRFDRKGNKRGAGPAAEEPSNKSRRVGGGGGSGGRGNGGRGSGGRGGGGLGSGGAGHGGDNVADQPQVWSTYRNVKDQSIDRLREKYKKYDENPQSHPNYQKEWSEFWHQRCDELRKENVNPDTYNFDQEWLPYFERRLRKMYLKEVTERKRLLRTKYGLPLSRRTPEPFNKRDSNISDQARRGGPGPVSNSGNMNRANKPPSLFATQPNIGGGFEGPSQGGSRGDSGRQRGGNRNPPQVPQLMQDQPSRKRPAPRREPVSIISVLSLLTALEDQLGSLGPKSVQLLSKAVLCEKNNQTNQLLTDNEYYILFATAKEKLKGQIIAHVIDRSKIEAANNAIEDLGKIINRMDNETRKQGNMVNAPNTGNRGSNFGGDNFGRNTSSVGGGGNFGNNSNAPFVRSGGMASGGNYRNENDDFRSGGGNFQREDGNYRRDGGNYRNDGGNYRDDRRNFRDDADNFRTDTGNFRNDAGNFLNEAGGFRNDNTNYRNEPSNFRNEAGNFGGNVRSMDDGGNNYRGGFNNDIVDNRGSNYGSGNYRPPNDSGNYRAVSDSGNFSSANNNMGSSNYRSNDSMGNTRGGNYDGGNTGNYRSGNMGGSSNVGGSTNNNVSSYRSISGTAGGNFPSGGSSYGASANSSSLNFTRNFTSDTNEYRAGGSFDNSKFTPSNYGNTGGGNTNTSAQRGNWMGGSGNVYSNISKSNLNPNAPAFSSGMGYQQSSTMSSFNNRNTASTGMSGASYGRYN